MIRIPQHLLLNSGFRVWILAWHSLRSIRFRKCTLKSVLSIAFILFIIITVTTRTVRQFYIFEADVKIIYIDTTDSITESELDGSHVFITGWKYHVTPAALPSAQLYSKNENSSGFWTINSRQQNVPYNLMEFSHFQLAHDHEIAIALRYFSKGQVKIHISFTDNTGKHATVMLYKTAAESNSKRFCTQIAQPPITLGAIEKVAIVVKHGAGPAFIALDKVVITVGNDRRSLHMMYTLIPTGWCANSGQSTVTEPADKRELREEQMQQIPRK